MAGAGGRPRWLVRSFLLLVLAGGLSGCFVARKGFIEPADSRQLVEPGTYRQEGQDAAFPEAFTLTRLETGYDALVRDEAGNAEQHQVDMAPLSNGILLMQAAPPPGGHGKLWYMFIFTMPEPGRLCFFTDAAYLSEAEKERYLRQLYVRDRAAFLAFLRANTQRLQAARPDTCYTRQG